MINPSLHEVMGRAITIAKAYAAAHTHEDGGNNHGDQVQFYLRMVGLGAGQPWCCAFVYTCLVKAFAQLTNRLEDRDSLVVLGAVFSRVYGIPRTGYVPAMWAALERLGLTLGRGAQIHFPALIFFRFDARPEPHHVGFLTADSGPGMPCRTCEGNTPADTGDQADGDGVFVKLRPRSHVFGFGVAA